MKRFITLLLVGSLYPATTPHKRLLELLSQDARFVIDVHTADAKFSIPLDNEEHKEFKQWLETRAIESNYFKSALLASGITTVVGVIAAGLMVYISNKS